MTDGFANADLMFLWTRQLRNETQRADKGIPLSEYPPAPTLLVCMPKDPRTARPVADHGEKWKEDLQTCILLVFVIEVVSCGRWGLVSASTVVGATWKCLNPGGH